MLKELEIELEQRGFSPEVRKAIRNAKICIIDDKIEDLKSLTDGLKKEGFTNIVEKKTIKSITDIVNEAYDLLILDLAGIAEDICNDDGIGAFAAIKEADPVLPVLIVSGSTITPDMAKVLSKAELIRTKPVLSADLALDVDNLLKIHKDEFWGALAILKEIHRLHADISRKLGRIERLKLWLLQYRITGKLKNVDPSITDQLLKSANILTKLGSIALRASRIAKGLGS